jgi:hypothetical protein
MHNIRFRFAQNTNSRSCQINQCSSSRTVVFRPYVFLIPNDCDYRLAWMNGSVRERVDTPPIE